MAGAHQLSTAIDRPGAQDAPATPKPKRTCDRLMNAKQTVPPKTNWMQGLFLPWALIAFVCCAPYIVYVALGIDKFTLAELLKRISWSALVVLPHVFFSYRKLYLLASLSALLTLGVVEIFHAITFHGKLTIASVFVFFESNLSEASQFLQMYVTPPLGAALLAFIVVSLFGWHRLRTEPMPNAHRATLGFVAYMFCIPFIIQSNVEGATRDPNEPYYGENANPRDYAFTGPFAEVVAAVEDYKTQIDAYHEEAAKRKNGTLNFKATPSAFDKKQLYVLILGESTDRNHMQIYGYTRGTNPRLTAERDDLLVFQNVISAFTHTQPALKAALTFSSQAGNKSYSEVYSILDLAHAAGFKTYWISNQSPIGIWDNAVSVLASTADETVFVNRTGDSTAALLTNSPDEKLLPPLEAALNSQDADKKFIILHLMGAHGTYEKRYPESFDHFTDTSTIDIGDRKYLDKERLDKINHYDNAIYYNDYVVSQIIGAVKGTATTTDSIASIVYVSDHGEEVYDTQDYFGHDWNRVRRHHVEIPFMVWVSDAFKRERSKTVQWMQANIDSPFQTDDLIYTLIDQLGIQTDLQDTRHSLFSAQYRSKPRLVYGVNYDTELRDKPKKATFAAAKAVPKTVKRGG